MIFHAFLPEVLFLALTWTRTKEPQYRIGFATAFALPRGFTCSRHARRKIAYRPHKREDSIMNDLQSCIEFALILQCVGAVWLFGGSRVGHLFYAFSMTFLAIALGMLVEG